MTSDEPLPGRCGAECNDGKYCEKYPITGRNRCGLHGGKTPRGKDSPHFKHGLFSDYLDEEDRAAVDAMEERGDAAKLDELINWRLARLRRAVRALNEDSEQNFWAAFQQLVDQVEEPEADQIKELAGMLSQGNRAMQEEIDLVRKLIRDRNKIAEGEAHNVSLRDLFGGDGS